MEIASGFLYDFFQYEVETRLKILSIQLASALRSLEAYDPHRSPYYAQAL
jgi:hypothetical protein